MVLRKLFLIAILALIGLTAYGQKNSYKAAGVPYTNGAPNWTPTKNVGSEIARDSVSGLWYAWDLDDLEWRIYHSVEIAADSTDGPTHIPSRGRPWIYITGADSLYAYIDSAWVHLNVSDGDGIYGGSGTTGEKATVATIDSSMVFRGFNRFDEFRVQMTASPAFNGTNTDFTADSVRIGFYDFFGLSWASVGPFGVHLRTPASDRVWIEGSDARYLYDYSSGYDSLSLINKAWADSTYINTFGSYGASNGDVLEWNGTRWTPGAAGGGAADGDGIYDGSGTVPTTTTATVTDMLKFDGDADATDFDIDMRSTIGTFGSRVRVRPDSVLMNYFDVAGTNQISVGPAGIYLEATSPDRVIIPNIDARYETDVSSGFGDLSLINKAWADSTYINTFGSYGATSGDVLEWNGTAWRPTAPSGGGTDDQTLSIDSTSNGSVEHFTLSIEDGNSVSFSVPQSASASIYAGDGISISNDSIAVSDTVMNIVNADFSAFALLDLRFQLPVSWNRRIIHATISADGSNVIGLGLPHMDSSSTDLSYIVLWENTGFGGSNPFRAYAQNSENTENFGVSSTFVGLVSGVYRIYGDKANDKWYVYEISRDYYPAGILVGNGSESINGRSITGTARISVTNGNAVSGNPTIDIAQQSATTGQVLKWNGTSWAPGTDNTGGGGGSGESNVGENLGSGTGIYAGMSDTTLTFKSLVEVYGIDISSDINEISLEVDTSEIATLTDVGQVQSDIDDHIAADGDLSATNEIQDISLDSTANATVENFILALTDGSTVTWSVPQPDGTGTDDQTVDVFTFTTGGNLNLSLEDDGEATNTISLISGDAGNDITYSTDGLFVDVSALEVDGSTTNEIQDISLDSTANATVENFILALTDGSTVTWSVPQPDGTGTDDQTVDVFTFTTGGNLNLSLEDDGEATQTVNLISGDAGNDITYSTDGLFVDVSALEVDGSTTNEIQDISLDSTANATVENFILALTDGSTVTWSVPQPDGTGTDDQVLTIDSTFASGVENFTLSIEDGNSITWSIPQGTVTSVGITDPTAGITSSGGPITTSGNITLSLSDDLAGLEQIDGLGIVVRDDSTSYVVRTLTGNSEINVSNGNGISGNPTLSLEQQGADVGQVLKWNGSTWSPSDDNTGGSGASGEANRGENLGGGVGMFAGMSDTTLTFKSLTDGFGISIASSATEVDVKVDTTNIATLTDIGLNIDSAVIAGGHRFEVSNSTGSVFFQVQDVQDLDLTGNTLSLTNDATSIDLSGYLDNTDDQTLTIDSTANGSVEHFTLSIEDGNSISFSVPQPDGTGTDDQTIDALTFAAGGILNISLENDGEANQTVGLISGDAGNDITYSTDGLFVDVSALEVDGSTTNEIQDISLDSTANATVENFILALTDGSTVTWSVPQPDGTGTDDQTLSIDSTSNAAVEHFTVSIEDGSSISFSVPQPDGTGTDDQTIDALTLAAGGVLNISLEDDGEANQTVGLISGDAGNDITFSTDGLFVDVSALEVDGSTTNEIQDISLDSTANATVENFILALTDGSTVTWSVPQPDGTGTDDQTIDVFTFTIGGNLNLSLEDDGEATNTINLISGDAGNDLSYSTDGLFVDVSANEVDGDPANEIQTIDVSTFTAGGILNLSLSSDGEATKTIGLISGDAGNDITYSTDGLFVDVSANEVDGSVTNEIQDISLDSTANATVENFILALTDGSTVTWSVPQPDGTGTDDQTVDVFTFTTGGNLNLSLEDDGEATNTINLVSGDAGNDLSYSTDGLFVDVSANEVDGDPANEIQTIDVSTFTAGGVLNLSLSDDGEATKTISLISGDAGNDITYSTDGLFVDVSANEVDGSVTNEIQDISLDSTANATVENFILALTDGSTVTWSVPQPDGTGTDDQTIDVLTLATGGILNISLEDDGEANQTVGLISGDSGNDITFSTDGLFVDVSANEVDGDPANEIQTIDVSTFTAGGILNLSLSSDGEATKNIGLISGDAGNDITYSTDGLFVDVSALEVDGSTTNEIQDISLDSTANATVENFILALTDGSTVTWSVPQPDGTGTDDQTVDVFTFTTGGNLNLSLEDDGEATNTINLISGDAGNDLTYSTDGLFLDVSSLVTPDGDGIYDGDGDIPDGTDATLASGGTFNINFNSGNPAFAMSAAGATLVGSDNLGTYIQLTAGDEVNIYNNGIETASFTLSSVQLGNQGQNVFVGTDANSTLVFTELSGGNTISFSAPSTLQSSQNYILPAGDPSDGDVLVWNTGDSLSWEAFTGLGGIYSGSGTIPASTVATMESFGDWSIQDSNGDYFIYFEEDSYPILWDGAGEASYGFSTDGLYITRDSTGPGAIILYEDEDNGIATMTLQSNPSIATSFSLTFPADDGTTGQVLTTDGSGVLTWETPSGGADGDGIYDGNGTAPAATTVTLTDYLQIGTGIRFANSTATTQSSYTIGNSSNTLNLGGSSGIVNISSSQSASNGAVQLACTGLTPQIGVSVVGAAHTSTSLSATTFSVGLGGGTSYTAASGSGTLTTMAIRGNYNLTGTASGIQRGLYINPTLTSLGGTSTYRSLDISANNASAWGIYQSGANTKNYMNGHLLLGTTTDVTGYNLVSNGPMRTNAGHIDVRGNGSVSGASGARVQITNTSGSNYLYLGVEDGDDVVIGTGDVSDAMKINADGTVSVIYSEVSDPTPGDGFYSGRLTTHTANETQALGDAVYIDADGEAHIADASSISTAGVLFMAAESITGASSGYYVQPGSYIQDNTWNWTPGNPVYLTITGATGNTLSQTAPSGTGEAVVIVGRATTADILYFYPQIVTVTID